MLAAEQDRAIQPMGDRASAGISQLPRWLAKMIAGLPSSRRASKICLVRAPNSTRLVVRMIDVVVPDVIEMGELGADAAEIVPHAGQNGFDLFRRFLGKAAVRFSRPMRSSRSLRPMKRVARPKKFAVLSGSK
jgi:hypothetical protein